MSRRFHPFVCLMCKRQTRPSEVGSQTCEECAGILDRQHTASVRHIEAMDPEARQAAGEAVFAAVQANLPPAFRRGRER